MNAEEKVFNKLFKEEKVELAIQSVKLGPSLDKVDDIVRGIRTYDSLGSKWGNKLSIVKKEMQGNISDLKKGIDEMQSDMNVLVRAGSEIDDIKKDLSGSGISTAPLDSRKNEIKESYNKLAKVSSDWNKLLVEIKNFN